MRSCLAPAGTNGLGTFHAVPTCVADKFTNVLIFFWYEICIFFDTSIFKIKSFILYQCITCKFQEKCVLSYAIDTGFYQPYQHGKTRWVRPVPMDGWC